MRLQLIRSATLRLEYAGKILVIDPCLAARHTLPSYSGRSLNPTVELQCSPAEVIAGADLTLISHLHSDHFDLVARRLLPKEMQILCQPGDKRPLQKLGFQNVTAVVGTLGRSGVKLTRVAGRHGKGKVLKEMGEVSGFVLEADTEPTIYWAGDTILCETVVEAIQENQPEIIVTHSCGAIWGDSDPIVMDAQQTIALCKLAPRATIIATHMDAFDHATVTRAALRHAANKADIAPGKLLIPVDMEEYFF